MKITRIGLAACLAAALVSCGGNDSSDTVAPVFISVDIPQGVADVDISVPVDVTIDTMSFSSIAKSATTTLSQQQDAILSQWVVTAERTDGGTVASPQWRNTYSVYVPAGGSTTLNNYRIFPAESFQQPPLNQLFPQNGGFDQETGQRNIRQRLHVQVFGKTVAGEAISTEFYVTINFFYVTP